MPRGDGTGPAGMGPMTGRAAGYCAGYNMPGYMNPWGGQFAAPYAMYGAGGGAYGATPYYGYGGGGGMPYMGTPYMPYGRGVGRGFFGCGIGRGIGRGRRFW